MESAFLQYCLWRLIIRLRSRTHSLDNLQAMLAVLVAVNQKILRLLELLRP